VTDERVNYTNERREFSSANPNDGDPANRRRAVGLVDARVPAVVPRSSRLLMRRA
jgi:hypothetical protein